MSRILIGEESFTFYEPPPPPPLLPQPQLTLGCLSPTSADKCLAKTKTWKTFNAQQFCTKNFSPVNDPIWFDFCFGLFGKRSLGRHNCRQQVVALECVIKMKIVGLIEAMFTYLYCFLCILIGFCATYVRLPVWRTGSQCSDFWGLKLLDSLSGYEEQEVSVLIFGA